MAHTVMAAVPTLVAFADLAMSRPGLDADAVTLAGWYERKAAVLRQLAAEGEPANQDTYSGWAAVAHAHARKLREEAVA